MLDTLTEKDIIPWGEQQPILQPAEVKRKQFLNILKRRLGGEEYMRLENKIEGVLAEATSFSWHPVKESMSFLKNNIPRYKNLKYPWEFGIPVHKSWYGPQGLERAKKAIRYVLEEKLKVPLEKIPEVAGVHLFTENNLTGMFVTVFNGHVFDAIDAAYPGVFRPWQFRVRKWNGPNAEQYVSEMMRQFIEEKLGILPERALKEVKHEQFKKYSNLISMLQCYFHSQTNDAVIKAVSIAYPNLFPKEKIKDVKEFVRQNLLPYGIDYNEWKIIKALDTTHEDWNPIIEAAIFLKNKFPQFNDKEVWQFRDKRKWKRGEASKELATQAIKWLVEEKIKAPINEIPRIIRLRHFCEYGLEGLLDSYCQGSPRTAIEKVYPNQFNEWEFRQANMWRNNNGKNLASGAVHFVVKEENIVFDEIPRKITDKLLKKYHLGGMLVNCFGGSVHKAIENAYPNQFKPWQFRRKIKWDSDEGSYYAKLAVKWLIEEKLKIPIEDIPKKVSAKLFYDNGFSGMLNNKFDSSVYKAINYAYPNQFKLWEFNKVPRNYWDNGGDLEKVVEASRWLIEEKLKIPLEDIPKRVNANTFKDNGLEYPFKQFFNASPYFAINKLYPNKFNPEEFKIRNKDILKNI